MDSDTESNSAITKAEDRQRYRDMQRRRGDVVARIAPTGRPGGAPINDGDDNDLHDDGEEGEEESLGTQFEVKRRSAKFNLGEYLRLYRPEYRAGTGTGFVGSFPSRVVLSRITPEDDAIVDLHAASFHAAHEDLARDLQTLHSLLEQILDANWSYWKFPFVPKCLLYSFCFVIAQGLAKITENRENAKLASIDRNTAFLMEEQRLQLAERSAERVQSLYTSKPVSSGTAPSSTRYTLTEARSVPTSSLTSQVVNLEEQRTTILSVISQTHAIRTALGIGLGISLAWTTYRAVRYGTIVWCKQSLAELIRKLENDELTSKNASALEGPTWSFLWWINIML